MFFFSFFTFRKNEKMKKYKISTFHYLLFEKMENEQIQHLDFFIFSLFYFFFFLDLVVWTLGQILQVQT